MSAKTNYLQTLVKRSANFQQFAKGYFTYLAELASRVDFEQLERVLNEFENAKQEGKNIFIIGNGGSAATASHMANDFSLGLAKAKPKEKPYRVISLSDNVPVLTACANDLGYDYIFEMQLKTHYNPGDRLLAISASGNSPNLLRAAEWVKTQRGKVMSFTGFSGGKLRELSDICVHVQTESGEYGPVEDIHMIFDHVFYSWLTEKV